MKPKPRTAIIGINWDKQPLGKMLDTELARILECTHQSVRSARVTRGIPPFAVKGGAYRKGTGKGRDKAKKLAAQRRWYACKREQGRVLSEQQQARKSERQRQRRAAQRQAITTRLAIMGVWPDET